MSWVKLDDRFLLNPKIMQAGLEARALYVAALCYCAGELTDGFIARNVAYKVAALADVEGTDAAIARLVDLTLWEVVAGGWRIHDYLDYNPSRDKAIAIKEARAEAGARGGQQKATKAVQAQQEGSVANGYQTPSKLLEAGYTSATNISKQNPTPSPSPVPLDLNSIEDLTSTSGVPPMVVPAPPKPVDNFTPWFALLWTAYPARRGKKLHKGEACAIARKIPARDWDRVTAAVQNYAASDQGRKGIVEDMHRFLRHWQDWETPETETNLAVIGGTHAPSDKLGDKFARIEQQIRDTFADGPALGDDPGADHRNVRLLRPGADAGRRGA
jgi:hypothetical protein